MRVADHARPKRSRTRRALAVLALTSGIAAGGVGATTAIPGVASAAGCQIRALNWAPVIVRTAASTAAGTDSGIRLNYGDRAPADCASPYGYYIGGNYTGCSSSGTPSNRWVRLTGAWSGYWVAWRCVSGPYPV